MIVPSGDPRCSIGALSSGIPAEAIDGCKAQTIHPGLAVTPLPAHHPAALAAVPLSTQAPSHMDVAALAATEVLPIPPSASASTATALPIPSSVAASTLSPAVAPNSSQLEPLSNAQTALAPTTPTTPAAIVPATPDHYFEPKGVPVFKPTWEEFRDFKSFVASVEPLGYEAGLVKIIPPTEWIDQVCRQHSVLATSLPSIHIRKPIVQNINGGGLPAGAYRQLNVEAKNPSTYNIQEWFELTETPEHHTPTAATKDRSYEKLSNPLRSLKKPVRHSTVGISAVAQASACQLPAVPQQQPQQPSESVSSMAEPSPLGAAIPAPQVSANCAPAVDPINSSVPSASPTADPQPAAAAEDSELMMPVQGSDAVAPPNPGILGPDDKPTARDDNAANAANAADAGSLTNPPSEGAAHPAEPSISKPPRRKRDSGAALEHDAVPIQFDVSELRTPYDLEYCKSLERYYWRNLTYLAPLYGADLPGSLFSSEVTSWNPQCLDSLLKSIRKKLPGVNRPYLYWGMWKATFAWHVEDMDLFSINYIHFGAPKQWYVVPPKHGKKFESVARAIFHYEAAQCPEFLRHKTSIMSPKLLRDNHVPFHTLIQQPGEIVITFPSAYHQGYNLGFNCAESVNFATESWLPIGKKARYCRCVSDSVRLDVPRLFEDSPKPKSKKHKAEPAADDAQKTQESPRKVQKPKAKLCMCEAAAQGPSDAGSEGATETDVAKDGIKADAAQDSKADSTTNGKVDVKKTPKKASPKEPKTPAKNDGSVPAKKSSKKVKAEPKDRGTESAGGTLPVPHGAALPSPGSEHKRKVPDESLDHPTLPSTPKTPKKPKTKPEPQKCCLCPNIGEELLPTDQPKKWAHRLCATYVTETSIGPDPENKEREIVTGVGNIPKARWSLKCSLCKSKGSKYGAPVQCSKGMCLSAFHITCAKNAGLHLGEALEGAGVMEILCPRHDERTETQRRLDKEKMLEESRSRIQPGDWVVIKHDNGGCYEALVQENQRESRSCKVFLSVGCYSVVPWLAIEKVFKIQPDAHLPPATAQTDAPPPEMQCCAPQAPPTSVVASISPAVISPAAISPAPTGPVSTGPSPPPATLSYPSVQPGVPVSHSLAPAFDNMAH